MGEKFNELPTPHLSFTALFICVRDIIMYGCYLIIKLTSMCDKSICAYKTYQHDAKYLFELYSMTLQTFSYVVPVSGNLLSKG
jgi:hypothetical protein